MDNVDAAYYLGVMTYGEVGTTPLPKEVIEAKRKGLRISKRGNEWIIRK